MTVAASPPPAIPCPACRKPLPIAVERYPEKGGTFPCPSCREPLSLPPKADFLAALAAARANASRTPPPAPAPAPARTTAPVAAPAPAAPVPPAAAVAPVDPVGDSAPLWIVAFGQGGGVEEVSRLQMRDLIRDGLVVGTTEVAKAGTRDYVPASEIPELARWLSMADERRRIVYIRPVSSTAESMPKRALHGLAYPFQGGALGTVLGLAVLGVLPFVSILAAPLASFWVLAVVRESARGEKVLPLWTDTSSILEVIVLWMKTIVVSFVALLPMVGWAAFWYFTGGDRSGPEGLGTLLLGLGAGARVSLAYYPACLATIAVWDSILDSLNPAYIARVIRTIGSDYAIVLLATVLAQGAGVGLRILSDSFLGIVPIAGHLPGRILTLWASLYSAHLLGWAIHRHQHDLGWD